MSTTTPSRSVHQILCDTHTELEERATKIQTYHDQLSAELAEAKWALQTIDKALKQKVKQRQGQGRESRKSNPNNNQSPRARFRERVRHVLLEHPGMTIEQLQHETKCASAEWLAGIMQNMINVGDVDCKENDKFYLTENGTPEAA